MEERSMIASPVDRRDPEEKSHIKNLLIGNVILLILTLAGTMYEPVMEQYLYKRISEEVFNVSHIPASNHSCYVNKSEPDYKLQEKAQAIAAEKQLQFTILQSCLAFVSNIMLGVYSDYVGRKVLFVVPITGSLIRLSLTAVIIQWTLDINYFFLSWGIDGLMGGYYGILMAVFVYTADNTPPTGSRTIGIALAEVPVFLAAGVMSTATGFFIQTCGFFYPSLVAAILAFIDLVIVVLFLPEDRYIERNRDYSLCITPLKGIKRVFGFYILEGSVLKRACFIIAIISFIFNILSVIGGSNINTLFLLNQPFCWSPEKLGIFVTAGALLAPIVGIPFTRLLQRFVPDEAIGVICSGTVAIADVLHSFASTDAVMYIVIGISSFGSTLSGVTRAILSRMVSHERQGSLFASIAVVETLCTLVGTLIFSNIYQHTVQFWRGFVFIAMAIAHVFGAIFLIIYIILSRRLPESPRGPQLIVNVEDEDEIPNQESE